MAFTPTVEKIGDAALTDSIINRSITELKDNVVTTLQPYALAACSSLKKCVFGELSEVLNYSFAGDEALDTLDIHSFVEFDASALQGLSGLKTLILRSNTMCDASSSAVLSYTPIEEGTGYIYVPRILVDSYKHDFVWGSYADQIRAIEDYPGACSDLGKVWTQTNVGAYYGTPALAYGDQLFVSVFNGGSSCNPFYSEDGANWVQGTGPKPSLNKVRYTGSVFVAGSPASIGLWYSEDGKAWANSNVTSGTISTFCMVNGVCIAVLNGTKVWETEDGKTWTQICTSSEYFSSLAYGNGVLVGGSGSTGGLWYSEDGGATWTQSNAKSGQFALAEFANGLFVAAGNKGIWYSEDGKTWSQSNTTGNYSGFLVCSDGTWVSGGYGKGVWYSEDGKNWSQSNLTSIYGMGCAVVDGLIVLGTLSDGLYYSTDSGKTWSQSNITSGRYDSIVYGDGVLVAGKNGGGVWRSTV